MAGQQDFYWTLPLTAVENNHYRGKDRPKEGVFVFILYFGDLLHTHYAYQKAQFIDLVATVSCSICFLFFL